MNNKKLIVTSYNQPDLDGVSSMYAYAEYLNKKSQLADYSINGIPKKEVSIVCDIFNIDLDFTQNKIDDSTSIIIVDTNSILNLSERVNPLNVVEIIDHHVKGETTSHFVNATIQIELIGAAATLVAEKFYHDSIPISRNAAILLYYGIVSNTINFKSNVTTSKDIQISNWLKSQYPNDITEEKIKEIFIKKSEISDNLRAEMEANLKINVGDKTITIGQLELANIEDFLKIHIEDIKNILESIKTKNQLDYIFLNCIDILNGYNIFVFIDHDTEKLVSNTLSVKCENGFGKTDYILMRKRLIPLIRSYLSSLENWLLIKSLFFPFI